MLERLMFKKIDAWIVLLLVLLLTLAGWMFGWAAYYKTLPTWKQDEYGSVLQNAFGDRIQSASKLPGPAVQLMFRKSNPVQSQDIVFREFAGLKRVDSALIDDGTLLVSSYSLKHEVSIAYLYEIATGKILHEWVPPVERIRSLTTIHDGSNEKRNYRTQHPLLLPNGDIIFTSGDGPLVRMTACNEIVWTIDRKFHHSIELSAADTLIVPFAVGRPLDRAANTKPTVTPLRDDGFAEISLDGKILKEWFVTDILERHGHIGLLYGVGEFEEDRIHLNDAQPILVTDSFARTGDIVLSVRHLSTVFMYRPSSDEIVWLKTGPWLNQHDVDYQGNGVFTIVGNDFVRGNVGRGTLRGYSTIWKFDQGTGKASEYLPLQKAGINMPAQGLHRVLADGDVWVEDSGPGLMHRVSANGLRWSYVHNNASGRIGTFHWSRYLTPAEAKFPWLAGLKCGQPKSQ